MRGPVGRVVRAAAAAALTVLAVTGLVIGASRSTENDDPAIRGASSSGSVTVAAGQPLTLDPAAAGDASSAYVIAQLFDGLTTLDGTRSIQPALADSWEISDGGRLVRFHLRPGLQFSDGSPLGAADVVRSWFRVIDPSDPSPLAGLLADVDGVEEYLRGELTDRARVGIRADGDVVEVRLRRPASDFISITAGPTFAVVPPGVGEGPGGLQPGPGFVGSGGYVLAAMDSDSITLAANPHYWGGPPAIGTVNLVSSFGGRSAVEVFEADEVDYTSIFAGDAAWIRYDETLGPQLRTQDPVSLDYYGFDTRRPPFNDARVRRAFATAVDWGRIVTLSGLPTQLPATGMVPAGIPGRSTADFMPAYDPVAARAELAAAGYPGGAGFPPVTLVSPGGSNYDEAVLAALKRELGVTVGFESMPFDQYIERLESDSPAMWELSWVADYPSPNDFLRVLLGSGQANNFGGWSSPAFDAAIADAGAAGDDATARAAYDRAEAVVRDEVPTIPASYSGGFALARSGLRGASLNGLGIMRMAGLAWDRP